MRQHRILSISEVYMKQTVLCILSMLVVGFGCSKGNIDTDREVLISKGFVNDTSYSIVCKGYPKEDLSGVSRIESAKRAALLSAYYYVQQIFSDSVAPDKDGKVQNYEVGEDFAIIHYLIQKKGLRKMLNKK
jgi:hypothetical protein